MAEELTNDVQDTSEGEGKNTDTSTGADTDNSKQNNQEEKRLTQSEVNDVVKRAKADAERAAKTKFEKGLEGKVVFDSQDALDTEVKKLVDAAIDNYKRETALTTKKAEYKSKGLTDAQLDVVADRTEKLEDFDKVATELFGALLKKDAPIINPGNNQKNDSSTDVDDLIGKALEKVRNR